MSPPFGSTTFNPNTPTGWRPNAPAASTGGNQWFQTPQNPMSMSTFTGSYQPIASNRPSMFDYQSINSNDLSNLGSTLNSFMTGPDPVRLTLSSTADFTQSTLFITRIQDPELAQQIQTGKGAIDHQEVYAYNNLISELQKQRHKVTIERGRINDNTFFVTFKTDGSHKKAARCMARFKPDKALIQDIEASVRSEAPTVQADDNNTPNMPPKQPQSKPNTQGTSGQRPRPSAAPQSHTPKKDTVPGLDARIINSRFIQ